VEGEQLQVEKNTHKNTETLIISTNWSKMEILKKQNKYVTKTRVILIIRKFFICWIIMQTNHGPDIYRSTINKHTIIFAETPYNVSNPILPKRCIEWLFRSLLILFSKIRYQDLVFYIVLFCKVSSFIIYIISYMKLFIFGNYYEL